MNTLLSNPVIEERVVTSDGFESFAKVWRWRHIAELAGMTFGRDFAALVLKGASRSCLPFSMRKKLSRSKDSITQGGNGDSLSAGDTMSGVIHDWASGGKTWGIARSATVLLCLAGAVLGEAQPQAAPCGLTSMSETTPLVFPPIARAAHVRGDVVSIVNFAPSGLVDDVAVISGPEMLKDSAIAYLKGLTANTYSGPRSCPMVVSFDIAASPPCENNASLAALERVDLQHVVIRAGQVWLCDPSGTIKRRKRFIFFLK